LKLTHTEIPLRFLSSLPEGIKLVNRHGQEYLVVEELYGPGRESLMSHLVHIHGEPSVRIGARVAGSEGLIFIDAFWGSHAKLYSFIPDLGSGAVEVEAFAPESGASLLSAWECEYPGCGSKRAIAFDLPGSNNRILVCARLGCPGHVMEIAELPHRVAHQVSGINFFGAGAEDLFRGI
jgi:hypothetical protein